MATTWTTLAGRSTRGAFTTVSEAAPTTVADGMNISDINGFIAYAEADSGQTFTGTSGTLLAYLYDDLVSAWARFPEADLTIPSGAVGTRRCAWSSFSVQTPRGRVAHVPSGLQVSGGGVTVTYACSTLYGERT